MKKADRPICWSRSKKSWPQINHEDVNQLLFHQELTMTPFLRTGLEHQEQRDCTWGHDMFLSVQQHSDLTDLTPRCVFTARADTQLRRPHNTLKMNVWSNDSVFCRVFTGSVEHHLEHRQYHDQQCVFFTMTENSHYYGRWSVTWTLHYWYTYCSIDRGWIHKTGE